MSDCWRRLAAKAHYVRACTSPHLPPRISLRLFPSLALPSSLPLPYPVNDCTWSWRDISTGLEKERPCQGRTCRICWRACTHACLAAAGPGAHSPMVFAFTFAGGSAADGLRRMTFFPVRSFWAGPLVSGPIPGSSRNIHILTPPAIHTIPTPAAQATTSSAPLRQPAFCPLWLFARPSNSTTDPVSDPATEGGLSQRPGLDELCTMAQTRTGHARGGKVWQPTLHHRGECSTRKSCHGSGNGLGMFGLLTLSQFQEKERLHNSFPNVVTIARLSASPPLSPLDAGLLSHSTFWPHFGVVGTHFCGPVTRGRMRGEIPFRSLLALSPVHQRALLSRRIGASGADRFPSRSLCG